MGGGEDVKAKDLVAVAAAVGITVVTGVSLYRYFKLGKTPGLIEAVAIPSMTGVMLYTMGLPAPTAEGVLRAGRLLPSVLGG